MKFIWKSCCPRKSNQQKYLCLVGWSTFRKRLGRKTPCPLLCFHGGQWNWKTPCCHVQASTRWLVKILGKSCSTLFFGPRWWFPPNAVGVYIPNIRVSLMKGGMSLSPIIRSWSAIGGGFKCFLIFTHPWGNDPSWLIIFYEVGWNHQW